jgi:ribulose-phosphate 3-epimerase
MIQIAPSILSADFSRLGEEIAVVERAGADLLHVDVMDGHYVDNLTFGPMIVGAIDRLTDLRLSTHLMITDPDRYAEAFIEAGSDDVIVHVEVLDDARPLLRRIRELGARPGVTSNPDTPFSNVEPYLDEVDLFLVMSVNPGWGGQAFIPQALTKAEQAAAIKRERGLPFDIHIDGGIGLETAPQAVEAGCEVLVAGSAIFKADDPAGMVRRLREIGDGAASGR